MENCCHLTQSAAASRNTMWISVTQGEIYTSILGRNTKEFSGPELISDCPKDSENVCCGQMSPHYSLFWGKTDNRLSVPKMKETIQTLVSDRCEREHLSCYGGALGYGLHVCTIAWRHILELYRDIYCHQDGIFHEKSMGIRSRQCQASFCMCYNSVVS